MSQFRKSTHMNSHSAKMNEVHREETFDADSAVKAIAAFSNYGTEWLTNRWNQQVEQDKIVQMERVAQGQLPTSTATVGGYRAAAELGLKLQNGKTSAYLNDLANDPTISKDQLNQAIGESIQADKDYLQANFNKVSDEDSVKLQNAASMGLISKVPELVVKREVTGLKQELQKRNQLFADFIVSSQDLEPEEFYKQFGYYQKELRIDPADARKALIEVAIKSGNTKFLETVGNIETVGKDMNGKDVVRTLDDVDPRISKAMDEIKWAAEKENAGAMGDQIYGLEAKFLNQEMSREEINEYIRKRNAETGGQFMTPYRAREFWARVDRTKAEKDTKTRAAHSLIINNNKTNIRNMPNKDKQEIATMAYDEVLQDQLAKMGDEGKTPQGFQQAQANAVRIVTENSNAQGIVIDRFKEQGTSVAHTNLDFVTVKGEDGKPMFTPEFASKLNELHSIPSNLRDLYFKGNTAKILNSYFTNVTDGAMTPVEAFKKAQLDSKAYRYQNSGAIYDLAKKAVDDNFDRYFWESIDDIPDSQRGHIEYKIQQYLSDNFNIGDMKSDSVKKQVSSWVQSNFTQGESGRVIFGNRTQLAGAMGIHPSSVSNVMDYTLEQYQDVIEQRLSFAGGTLNDTYWDTDLETGRVTLKDEWGNPVIGTTFSFQELGKLYRDGQGGRFRQSVEKLEKFKKTNPDETVIMPDGSEVDPTTAQRSRFFLNQQQ